MIMQATTRISEARPPRTRPAAWWVALGLTVTLCSFPVMFGAGKPNVVLIYIDDLGYGDLASYGCKDIPTPHIDRLAICIGRMR